MIDVAAGTPELAWQQAPQLTALPQRHLDRLGPGEVVVVAPHPDDEVLGVGGTVARLHELGRVVRVVAVTDGEASHPGSVAVTAQELAARRADESVRALRHLGVTAPVERLGVPDGHVADHEEQLAHRLEELVVGAALVLAPWREDGHPDHDASGRAATAATTSCAVHLAEYLVWAWNWARPDDPTFPWARAGQVPLSPAAQRAKARAITEFRSQVEPLGPEPEDGPVLPEGVLAYHRRPFEVLLG